MTPYDTFQAIILRWESSYCCLENEQSHLTETNCCCSCLVMSQWLVFSKSASETCLAMLQMYFYFIHCDIVEPVHVTAMKGPSYLIVFLFKEQPSSVLTFITAEWRLTAGCISSLQSTQEHVKFNAGSLIFAELSHFLSWTAFVIDRERQKCINARE